MKSPNQQYYWFPPIQNLFLYSILFVFLLTAACSSGKKAQQNTDNSRTQTTAYPPNNKQSKGVVIVPPYTKPTPPSQPKTTPPTQAEINKARAEGLKIAKERAAARGQNINSNTPKTQPTAPKNPTTPKTNPNTKPTTAPKYPNTPPPPTTTKVPPTTVPTPPKYPNTLPDTTRIPTTQPSQPTPEEVDPSIFQPPPPQLGKTNTTTPKSQPSSKPSTKPTTKPAQAPVVVAPPTYPNTGYTGRNNNNNPPATLPNTGYTGNNEEVAYVPPSKPKAAPKKPTNTTKPTVPTPNKPTPKKTTKPTPKAPTKTAPETPKAPTKPTTDPKKNKPADAPKVTTPPAPDPMIPVRPVGVPDEPFNVAVMLPFLNSDVFQGANGQVEFGEKTRLALQFYEGMMLGVEQLKGEGIDINMRVYDTQSDASVVRNYLNDPSMKEADLILGPIYNKPLQAAAQFAKRNRIPVVSPLSPSTTITAKNPYYIVASPPIETHCASMYNYIMQHYSSKNIIALTTNSPDDQNLARTFYNISQKYSLDREGIARNNITQVVFTKDMTEEELEGYLSSYDENIIIAATSNEQAINDASIKLNTLNKRYSMSLFGMPNWWNMKEIDLENIANLNFHISSPYFMDQYDPYHQQFAAAFLYRYGSTPSQNAAVGFDLMSYFGNLYKDYGKDFESYLVQDKQEGIYTIYDFQGASPTQYQPNNNATLDPDYLENKFVNILRINRNGQLEKVNF